MLCLLVALAAAISAARAQEPGRIYRLTLLASSELSVQQTIDYTLPALERLGFVSGRNLIFTAHVGAPDHLPAVAQRVAASRPDAILAVGGDSLPAAANATRTVPIVVFGPDPVALGFANSLARPGANITGIVILAPDLDAKRLEFLHQAVPAARRIAILLRRSYPTRAISESAMQAVAARVGVDLRPLYAEGPAEYPAAFAAMRAAGMEGLAVVSDPVLLRDAAQLIALASEARLPAICPAGEMARAGCLLSYSPDLNALRARLAGYLAQIFRGTSPAEMPIEQPTRFQLFVNLRTARALGLTIPLSILVSADEVIE